jgi:superfamily II helicase
MKTINSNDIILVDCEGNIITGIERDKKLLELKNTGTMLDAWIQGEDDNNPYKIIWIESLCESCLVASIKTPATTHSTNPDWAGYELCEECAQEYNNRKPIK